jgi:hypothetical protein
LAKDAIEGGRRADQRFGEIIEGLGERRGSRRDVHPAKLSALVPLQRRVLPD